MDAAGGVGIGGGSFGSVDFELTMSAFCGGDGINDLLFIGDADGDVVFSWSFAVLAGDMFMNETDCFSGSVSAFSVLDLVAAMLEAGIGGGRFGLVGGLSFSGVVLSVIDGAPKLGSTGSFDEAESLSVIAVISEGGLLPVFFSFAIPHP